MLDDPSLKLKQGQTIVDDQTNEDDANKYKLFMVGRKVTQTELDENPQLKYMLEVNEESKHNISSDVYHESGE
jgi:lipopolysaccharide/colanic/teichoic acid biosynthesis glycosyltransferase